MPTRIPQSTLWSCEIASDHGAAPHNGPFRLNNNNNNDDDDDDDDDHRSVRPNSHCCYVAGILFRLQCQFSGRNSTRGDVTK